MSDALVLANVDEDFGNVRSVFQAGDVDFDIDLLFDSLYALTRECEKDVIKNSSTVAKFIESYSKEIDGLRKMQPSVDDFEVLKKLGQGAYGMVKLVRHKITGNVHAMKMMHKKATWENAERTAYMEERHVLAHGDDRWITPLHYAFQDDNFLYLVMEFVQGGDLFGAIENLETLFNESQAKIYAAEMINAIHSVHELGYVHRDIKMENFLVSDNGHIRLADFGTCCKVDEEGQIRSSIPVGTAEYVAPEVLDAMYRNGTYSYEVDWWAFGLCIFEMVIGYLPFEGDSLMEINHKITNFKDTIKFPDEDPQEPEDEDFECTDDFRNFIHSVLCEREKRLDYEGMKKHPWFSGIDFDKILSYTPPLIPDLSDPLDTKMFPDESEFEDPSSMYGNYQDSNSQFTGAHLPFVGYSYTKSLKLQSGRSIIRKKYQHNLEETTTSSATTSATSTRSGEDTEKILKEIQEKDQKIDLITKDLTEHKDNIQFLNEELKKKEISALEATSSVKKMEEENEILKKEVEKLKQRQLEGDEGSTESGSPLNARRSTAIRRGTNKSRRKSLPGATGPADPASPEKKDEGVGNDQDKEKAKETEKEEEEEEVVTVRFRPEVMESLRRKGSLAADAKKSLGGGSGVSFEKKVPAAASRGKSGGLGRAKSVKYGGGLSRGKSMMAPSASQQKNVAKIEQDLHIERSLRQEAQEELSDLKLIHASLEQKFKELEARCAELEIKAVNRSTPELILDKVEEIERQMKLLTHSNGLSSMSSTSTNNNSSVHLSITSSVEDPKKQPAGAQFMRRSTIRRPRARQESE